MKKMTEKEMREKIAEYFYGAVIQTAEIVGVKTQRSQRSVIAITFRLLDETYTDQISLKNRRDCHRLYDLIDAVFPELSEAEEKKGIGLDLFAGRKCEVMFVLNIPMYHPLGTREELERDIPEYKEMCQKLSPIH